MAHQERMLAAAVRGLHGAGAAAEAQEVQGGVREAQAGPGAEPGPGSEAGKKPEAEAEARTGPGASGEAAGRDTSSGAGATGTEPLKVGTREGGNGAASTDMRRGQQAKGEGQRQRYKPGPGAVHLSVKCAGIHWWYKSASHAAELTAGYYNPRGRNGYAKILATCRDFGAGLNFTCVEMRNSEQPAHAHCGPEELLKQVGSRSCTSDN